MEETFQKQPQHVPRLGSTGSRLLTGDSEYTRSLEVKLAEYHNSPAALLANSGYDANLAVLSTLSMNNLVLMDELCHNSQQMGIRLSRNCEVKRFQHNDVDDLERLLKEYAKKKTAAQRHCIIVIESVYSMDGDKAPVVELFDLALRYKACVIVDEAHGLPVIRISPEPWPKLTVDPRLMIHSIAAHNILPSTSKSHVNSFSIYLYSIVCHCTFRWRRVPAPVVASMAGSLLLTIFSIR